MFALEDENVLFLYCWTFNEMQIPAMRTDAGGAGDVERPQSNWVYGFGRQDEPLNSVW